MMDNKILIAVFRMTYWFRDELAEKLNKLGFPEAAIVNTIHNINQAIKAGATTEVITGYLFVSTRTLHAHFVVYDDPKVNKEDHEETSHRGFTKYYFNVNTFPEAIARANLLGIVTYAYERQ